MVIKDTRGTRLDPSATVRSEWVDGGGHMHFSRCVLGVVDGGARQQVLDNLLELRIGDVDMDSRAIDGERAVGGGNRVVQLRRAVAPDDHHTRKVRGAHARPTGRIEAAAPLARHVGGHIRRDVVDEGASGVEPSAREQHVGGVGHDQDLLVWGDQGRSEEARFGEIVWPFGAMGGSKGPCMAIRFGEIRGNRRHGWQQGAMHGHQ